MRKWIDLFESDAWLDDMHDDFDWDKLLRDCPTQEYILPANSDLYHGTEGGWTPSDIRGPAWFGTREMAHQYAHAVFNHDHPTVYHYVTAKPYRLLLIDGEIGKRIFGIMDGGEVIPSDVALTICEGGWDGWIEPNGGEIMIGDPSGLKPENVLGEGVDYRNQLETGYETFHDVAADHAQNSFSDDEEMPDLSREAYMQMADDFLHDVLGRPLYRGMMVRQIDLENARHLGVFYSEVKGHADGFARGGSRYDGRFDHIDQFSKDQIGIVIEIEPITDPNQIDLPITLAMNTFGGEGEVRLLEGETVTIKRISDLMGRAIWPHLWGQTYHA